MALTPEQVAEIEIQEAREAGRRAHELTLEATRHTNNLAAIAATGASQVSVLNMQAKIEAIRLAKEILIENARIMPVDERGIKTSDVTNFANSLIDYIKQD